MADNKEKTDVITLEFEDGEELECEIIGTFDVNDEEFIALVPDDNSGDVYIYAFSETEDGFDINEIEDEDKFNMVVAEFEKLMEEESDAE